MFRCHAGIEAFGPTGLGLKVWVEGFKAICGLRLSQMERDLAPLLLPVSAEEMRLSPHMLAAPRYAT